MDFLVKEEDHPHIVADSLAKMIKLEPSILFETNTVLRRRGKPKVEPSHDISWIVIEEHFRLLTKFMIAQRITGSFRNSELMNSILLSGIFTMDMSFYHINRVLSDFIQKCNFIDMGPMYNKPGSIGYVLAWGGVLTEPSISGDMSLDFLNFYRVIERREYTKLNSYLS